MSQTLYELSEDLAAINDLLTEVGGEITAEDVELIIDSWLEEARDALTGKLDNYVSLIRQFEARADWRKKEAARLRERAEIDQSAADRLKARLKWFFEKHALERFDTPRFGISLAKNGGKTPIVYAPVVESSPASLPEEFHKRTITADKEAIRAALERGEQLEFAALGERGRSIRIR